MFTIILTLTLVLAVAAWIGLWRSLNRLDVLMTTRILGQTDSAFIEKDRAAFEKWWKTEVEPIVRSYWINSWYKKLAKKLARKAWIKGARFALNGITDDNQPTNHPSAAI